MVREREEEKGGCSRAQGGREGGRKAGYHTEVEREKQKAGKEKTGAQQACQWLGTATAPLRWGGRVGAQAKGEGCGTKGGLKEASQEPGRARVTMLRPKAGAAACRVGHGRGR